MKEIVVSVCARTAKELVSQIKQAYDFADVIEVRFDCLEGQEFDITIAVFSHPVVETPLLATCRPQPGEEFFYKLKFPNLTDEEKKEAKEKHEYLLWKWEQILSVPSLQTIDLESEFHLVLVKLSDDEDSYIKSLSKEVRKRKRIISEHYFDKIPSDEKIERAFDALSEESDPDDPIEWKELLDGNITKIAAQTDDISDGLALWKLLKKAKSENKQLVPIAMGEAGKWTRILGLAYGAPMTYAALETGKEVAPGQISAEDLRDVYRVKELNEETEIYGVIGDPVKFSLSPYMQNEAFKVSGKNAVFVPFEVKDLDTFITRFLPESGLNIRGFSVTIPHKQAIMKYLDEIDETAQKIGAVNTVKIVDGKLHGYNTDAPGFISPLKQEYGELAGKRAAIIGAGGAARAVIYALQKEGAEVTVFARDMEKATPLKEQFNIELKLLSEQPFSDYNVVINATPLGMKGKFEGQTPSTSGQLEGAQVAYDLIYTPDPTPFMTQAEKATVPIVIGGLKMLVAQGAEQFRIWTSSEAPVDVMEAAVRKRL